MNHKKAGQKEYVAFESEALILNIKIYFDQKFRINKPLN